MKIDLTEFYSDFNKTTKSINIINEFDKHPSYAQEKRDSLLNVKEFSNRLLNLINVLKNSEIPYDNGILEKAYDFFKNEKYIEPTNDKKFVDGLKYNSRAYRSNFLSIVNPIKLFYARYELQSKSADNLVKDLNKKVISDKEDDLFDKHNYNVLQKILDYKYYDDIKDDIIDFYLKVEYGNDGKPFDIKRIPTTRKKIMKKPISKDYVDDNELLEKLITKLYNESKKLKTLQAFVLDMKQRFDRNAVIEYLDSGKIISNEKEIINKPKVDKNELSVLKARLRNKVSYNKKKGIIDENLDRLILSIKVIPDKDEQLNRIKEYYHMN